METNKRIVLDANILIRAVLGRKVRSLLETYASEVQFYTPDVCYEDAKKYLSVLFEKPLMLSCPIWTEDADFFGAGVATWTSDRVHLYFSS
ncbi:MAG: PIN domain-containing protein [Synechococcales bacterium]|nr:PIN domain-containing protein [Synechococcales bacterium]